MKILAIDTSCDETAAAVTENTKIISNIIWSQASQHADFGGVMPSLAQRLHRERIDFVVNRALSTAHCSLSTDIDAIAVTIGPGLAIALEVGISKAKQLSQKYNRPIIPVNHIEGHLLSCFAQPRNYKLQIINYKFPMFGLVISGGNTQLIYIEKIGSYKVLAETVDDALGEALDKCARVLGLGYPGGAVLEKFARLGNAKKYVLPTPLVDDKIKNRFSYSGIKTAMFRLIEKEKPLTKEKICNLATSFQEVAFKHIENVLSYQLNHKQSLALRAQPLTINHFLLGGGVANNNLLRSKLRKLLKPYKITLHTPYSKKLCGDNAAMIGVCAYLKLKARNEKLRNYKNSDFLDRIPRMKF
ncbi:MAG: tRNA (adenosine(37)-N6)-threonylcarbamoyltransferase complex transferase subunit TsaD [Candidatus Woesebacteria bacterium]|nr:tRNA (adenosine(37)-N6)-threonylcarbamoyltransferase complex transferase subunit TsaD [Candidatus Woesebacteria bacterium]